MKLNFIACILCLSFVACRENSKAPTLAAINALNLKKGQLITCGPSQELGSLQFTIDAPAEIQSSFMLALKLLHSFEYDEAEKVFAGIIDKDPKCAMAYWGVAMSNFHPLWTPPSISELQKGANAIAIARNLEPASKRETAYINAIGAYYDNWQQSDHKTRCLRFEDAMHNLHNTDTADVEAAVLYALALDAAAEPTDKTFGKQKKAGEILNALAIRFPNHPGITHYIIHTYDAPEIAIMALPAARRYSSIAPGSAHALHMPSHIFTRLGLWDEDIQSNQASVSSAQCYAQQSGIPHWDEEMHGLDYLIYAYLQKGDNLNAKKQLDYLLSIKEVVPANFKVAYAFAAIPSRYCLENRLWAQAAALPLPKANFDWNDHVWPKAMIHFARLLGAVHTNQNKIAEQELESLKDIRAILLTQEDAYKAQQVQIQLTAGEAWMQLKSGNKEQALKLMREAADLEDKTEKHPITPSEVLPAAELLGDMLMELKDYPAALNAYERNLKRHPNTFNTLYSAATAASNAGDQSKANSYYKQLVQIADHNSTRTELVLAKKIIN